MRRTEHRETQKMLLLMLCWFCLVLLVARPGAAEQLQASTADEHAAHAGHAAGGAKVEPALRDPDAYAEGVGYGPLPRLVMGDQHLFGGLLLNRLEGQWHREGPPLWAYDLQAWYGRSFDRLLLRSEGELKGGDLDKTRTELYWVHALTAYWDSLLGARADLGKAAGQGWLAVGLQGLAPYWIELKAGLYVGHSGQMAAKLEVEYEQLLTQRLVLQPRFELVMHSKRDAARETGSGLSGITAGARLRYELTRELAPYLGFEWHGAFGETRTITGEDSELRLVGGVRLRY